jgi:hypothetical protein
MNYGKVDISLTSISSRMDTVCATLRSLLAQDYSDLQIHLHLSPEPYLLDKGVPNPPEALLDLQRSAAGRLQIYSCRNTGPYRKLLPYLKRNWGQSKLVVTADDDTVYPTNWLRSLITAYDQYGCVIAYRGHHMQVSGSQLTPYRSWMGRAIEENPSRLILPTGKDGILYDTAFFPINVLNVEDAMQMAPTADDLWFRWHLAMNGIQTYLINMDYKAETFTESDYETSLYLNFNRGGSNDVAIAALEQYFQTSFRFSVTGVLA